MIETLISRTIDTGTGPFTYTWSADVSCVSFSKPTGTINLGGKAETTVYFTDYACYTSATITLDVFGADGCTSSETVVVSDPCASLAASPISVTGNYTFNVSGGDASSAFLDFEWTYNTDLFDVVSQLDGAFTSALSVLPKGKIPVSTNISVKVTSQAGCSVTKTYNYVFCIPRAADMQVELSQLESGQYISPLKFLTEPTGCQGYTYNFASASFLLPDGWSALVTALTPDRFNIIAPQSATPGVYIGTYTIRTTTGITSHPGTLTLIIPEAETEPIVIADRAFDIPCTALSGDTLEFLIEDLVTATDEIDWSTWALTSSPTPFSTSIALATNIDGDHIIEYEVPNPVVSDYFGWTVADINGNYARASVTTARECTGTPTANADAGVCACGGSVIVDVLSNDATGGAPFLVNSITITSSPTKGTIALPGDGTIMYIANFDATGTDQFDYTVRNAYGNVSNEATVTITLNCAGVSAEYTLCD